MAGLAQEGTTAIPIFVCRLVKMEFELGLKIATMVLQTKLDGDVSQDALTGILTDGTALIKYNLTDQIKQFAQKFLGTVLL